MWECSNISRSESPWPRNVEPKRLLILVSIDTKRRKSAFFEQRLQSNVSVR